MTSLENSSGEPAGDSAKRGSHIASLLNRLADRHSQSRRERSSNLEPTGFEKSFDFLPRFLQTKSEILANLNVASDKVAASSISNAELTQVLDDTVMQLDDLQKSLNDAALYLTAFDLEQARLELKSLNNEFQIKREQLIPPKKFAFTRKPKVQSSTSRQQEAMPLPQDDPVQRKNEWQETQLRTEPFNPEFSETNIVGPRTLVIPKSAKGYGETLLEQTVYLADLTDCTIHVVGVCGNLIANRLVRCFVYTHPVAGSVWIDNCQDCDLVTACRQLRIHETISCRLGLHMASRPIIEHSTGLSVAPYPLSHSGLPTQLQMAGLTEGVNYWNEVEDFSHPNKRLTTGSPNWSVLPETEWSTLIPQKLQE